MIPPALVHMHSRMSSCAGAKSVAPSQGAYMLVYTDTLAKSQWQAGRDWYVDKFVKGFPNDVRASLVLEDPGAHTLRVITIWKVSGGHSCGYCTVCRCRVASGACSAGNGVPIISSLEWESATVSAGNRAIPC